MPAKEGASAPVPTTPALGSGEQFDRLQHENEQMKVQMLELNCKLDLLVQGTVQQARPAHPTNLAITEKRTRREESAGHANTPRGKSRGRTIPV